MGPDEPTEAVVANDNPAVPARRLAQELRRLRKASNKTQEHAAEYVGTAATSISKIENMERNVPLPYLKLLIACYGVDEAHAETLFRLADEARQPPWWHPFRDIVPRWFTEYISLETAAGAVWTYESEFVPGLLQTRRYTEALTSVLNRGGPANNADGYLAVRSRRQERLADLNLRAIINEGALCRAVGGAEVMREQLAWLREVGARSNVAVQVLPFSAGAHSAMTGPFNVLRFPEPQMNTIYIEYSSGAVYLQKAADLDRYTASFEEAAELALDERGTVEFIEMMERRC